jgi:maleylacetoacetate isomerase
MKLHNFHSSSTSFRVRIALAVKGLSYEYVPVRLDFRDGDHDRPEYQAFNPQRNVPVLVDGEVQISQSMAICDYLDRVYPEKPIFPSDAKGRARVMQLALWVACEIQGPNNLRIERYLVDKLGQDQDGLRTWRCHWAGIGFEALERQLADNPATGRFSHGDEITVADCFIVPAIYNALRPVNRMDLHAWPTLARIYDACLAHPAVQAALPKNQPDFAELKAH